MTNRPSADEIYSTFSRAEKVLADIAGLCRRVSSDLAPMADVLETDKNKLQNLAGLLQRINRNEESS